MRYLILFSAFFLMTSCSIFQPGANKNIKTIPINSLTGTSWALDSLINFTAEKGKMRPVTLSFSDTSNSVFGSGGCNYYNARFSQDKSKLSFSHILSTKMYCQIGSKTETKFTSVMLQCNRAAQDKEGHLLLMKDKEILAIFSKSSQTEN